MCGYLAQGSELVDAVRLANAVASIAVATPGSHLGPIDSALVERLRRHGVSTQEVPHRP
jgi:sugar/nucleoside kinase (ribokinase family)